jgi:peptidoglycan/xylan/chitin deacetylase (PgdA/CDA1 family)
MSREEIIKNIKYKLGTLMVGMLVIVALMGIVNATSIQNTVETMTTVKKLPIYCVDTNKKQVALSFDAAWGNEDTAQILKVLKDNDVKVTFFMTGGWIERYPEDVKAIYKAGHDLGNHSENHKQMSTLSSAECEEELKKAHDKIYKLTGEKMNLFRPPYGDYNNTVLDVAKSMGYHTVQWDIDILDIKVNKI